MRRNRQRPAANLGSDQEPAVPESLDIEAAAEWSRVTALLRQRGALDALDQAALHDYLVCWQRLRTCERDIAARGVLVDGERGKVKNPSIQIARQYRDALVAWSREFGLTYAARTRLAMPEGNAKSENKFERLRRQTA